MKGIYKITNNITSNKYIGSSNNIRTRWSKHKHSLNSNTHKNLHLQNAWNKYGSEKFEFEVILLCEEDELFFYEQKILDTLDYTSDYNISKDATAPWRGKELSEEHKRKIKETQDSKLDLYPEEYVPTDLTRKYCPADEHGSRTIYIKNWQYLCNRCHKVYGGNIADYPEWLQFAVRDIQREQYYDYSHNNHLEYNDSNDYDSLVQGHRHSNVPRPSRIADE